MHCTVTFDGVCVSFSLQVTLPEDTSYRLGHTTTIINGTSPIVVVDGGERGGKPLKDTVIFTLGE